jgi:hypothetical protein
VLRAQRSDLRECVISGIKEVIFEYNEIKPGGASPSWGNNIVRSNTTENSVLKHFSLTLMWMARTRTRVAGLVTSGMHTIASTLPGWETVST